LQFTAEFGRADSAVTDIKYIHRYIHTYINTYIHTHIQTYVNTNLM